MQVQVMNVLTANNFLATIGKFELFPEQASTMAPKVDLLYFYLTGVTVFFSVIIAACVVAFAVIYRRKSEDDRPPEVHPSKLLEASWIIIPFILTMVMFAWGAVIFVNYSRPPANAMEINVVGKQWMWKVQHPDGQREINELHVPVGQPVRLTMTSQDVIHDFGIPAFRVKNDVLPGRYTSEWFEATKVGEYHLFCDQYCGTEHSRMVGKVVVLTAQDYQAWLSGARKDETPSMAGMELFKEYSCVNCHSQEAPSMANVYGSQVVVWEDGVKKTITADESYIRDSILYPNHQIVDGYQPLMPSYKGRLSEEQILQLVAYIKTLGVGKQGGRVDPLKYIDNSIAPPTMTPNPSGLTK
jgi:cytochrome c oxidase subunit 2